VSARETAAERRSHASERGQALVFVTIAFVVLLAFVGVVVDNGMYFVQRRDMQGNADAAAMAAVRELPGDQGAAAAIARSYGQDRNGGGGATIDSIAFLDGGTSVRVTSRVTGNASFGDLLGLDAPTIRGSATAQVRAQGPMSGMLPLAFMRDSFTVGQNFEVKFDGSAGGNRGGIAPQVQSSCAEARGASDFRDLIIGAARGGDDACAMALGSVVSTEPGNMSGPTRQGFDARLGTDDDTFTEVFRTDPATGTTVALLPSSPRIGIIPVVEQTNGANTWPNGRSNIRILSYMLCYIGKTDTPGNPAWTDNGRSVWVTPVRAILPEEFAYDTDSTTPYNPGIPSPMVFRLTE